MNPSPAEERATIQSASSPDAPVVSVADLRTHFDTPEGIVRAVDGVSFQVPRGKVFGLVGEHRGQFVLGEAFHKAARHIHAGAPPARWRTSTPAR